VASVPEKDYEYMSNYDSIHKNNLNLPGHPPNCEKPAEWPPKYPSIILTNIHFTWLEFIPAGNNDQLSVGYYVSPSPLVLAILNRD